MDKAVQYIWVFISGDCILSAFFLMLEALLVKSLLLSFYFSLLYAGIWCVKKVLHKRMSIYANYYCWYALSLSIMLANLNLNDYFKMLFYRASHPASQYIHYAYLTACLLSTAWLIRMVYKLASHILLNRKMQKSLKFMERYDDSEHLAERAIKALALRGKVAIVIADFIDSPVSYGIIKKAILLPWNYQYKYSSDELYLLLLHEAAHIKNGDTVKLRLISLAECFIWPTPVMRLFRKHFRRDTEILCDNRVMCAQGSERDIYGDLLLKECSDRTASMGFGFSDSYHTLEQRLDALYRYKSEKRSYTLTSAVIVMLLLFASSAIHYIHADYLDINKDANAAFEIMLINSDYTEFEFLDSSQSNGIYKVTDGEIDVDKISLYELIEGFRDRGYVQAYISSDRYTLTINNATLVSADGFTFTFNELRDADETNRHFIKRLKKIQLIERAFLFVINKI